MTVPLTIAHRAGNSYDKLERALAAGVDAIEIDVRLDRGRFAARHDGRLLHLPVYGGRWHVRFSLARESYLDDVLRRVDGTAPLLVDVKNREENTLRLLLDALRAHNAIDETLMSSAYWDLMRLAQESEPGLKVYYSIGKPAELVAFWERRGRSREAKSVSIKHTLLDGPLADRFLAEGIDIAAYTLADVGRARQLVDWGVSAIISDDLSLLREVKAES